MRHAVPASPLFLCLLATSSSALASETILASRSTTGGPADGSSVLPAISADGRYVAFESDSTNLVPGDTNASPDMFVFDRLSGSIERVDVSSAGDQAVGGSPTLDFARAVISADGRFVVFPSSASNLVPGDSPDTLDLFLRDRTAGTTTRLNVDATHGTAETDCEDPAISPDGRFVAFSAFGSIGLPHSQGISAYVLDQSTGIVGLVSVDSNGVPADSASIAPRISADGRIVVFHSFASNLVPNGGIGAIHCYVHDRLTGATARVSVSSSGVPGDGASSFPDVSADGRWVVFTSTSTNLIDGQSTNGGLFLHDLSTHRTERLADTVPVMFGSVGAPAMSADGRHVAFVDGNGQAVVLDRDDGTISRASVSSSEEAGDGASGQVAISADGSLVAFESESTNLVANDTNSKGDCFVRDRRTLLSVQPSIGSAAGGELVHLLGSSFAPGTSVSFGASAATIVSAAADRIVVRTPPGSGVVDVSVSSVRGRSTLRAAYTFVAPELAARYGDVNVGAGDRESVLLANGVVGDETTRELSLAVGQPITAVMVQPSSRASARFAMYAWGRAPRASTLAALPRGVGSLVFPPPFLGGAPAVVWNNVGRSATLGAPTMSSQPAPSVLFQTSGSPTAVTVTLQGLIEDAASPSGTGFSVTNAIVLRIGT
jgi:Tol biopolymer transport system component